MLRTELRRLERRRTTRTRWIASITAVAVALGLAVSGSAVATANPNATLSTPIVSSGGVTTYNQGGLTCSSDPVGFTKPGALDGANLNSDGSYSAAWGSISWDVSERTVTWTVVPGWDVDVCVKGGTHLTTIDTSASGATSYTHTYAGLSHLGFRINAAQPTNALDCDVATNYPGRALTNGDHINMDIVQGGQKFQVNASVDIRQSHDPVSESGLVLRVNAPGGPYTLPITNDQKNSGILSFSYATYLTGPFTVEWVQFNSTYFNQDRDVAEFLVCGDLPTDSLVTPTARMVPLACDTAGSYTLDDIEGVRWFIGDQEVQPGTYTVSTATTVSVRAEAEAPEFGIEPGAQTQWTFTFTEPVDCVLPCLPASAVSYTYYNLSNDSEANPANSGVITVAAREGYSTELCNDFWVVAAAWNYSSSTSIWPQTLRSTDPAGTNTEGYIGSVGTYFFHAPVACGQGDVYASFTGMPYVGPELFGPNNPFSETFLHNMGFSGPNPTYLNTAPGCNVVNPIAPTANPIVECDTLGSIDISDVANPYIGYTVYRGAADESGSVAGLETVNLVDATEGVFTVVATPMGGTIFAPGTVRQWEFDLGERYDCPIDADLRLTYIQECAPDSTYTFRVRNAESVSVPYTYTVYGNPSLNGSGVAAPGDSFFDLDVERTATSPSYTVILQWGDGTTILAESTTKASGPDLVCELPELPITNASIGFIAPTCDLGQQLDPTKFVVDDAELARYAPELSTLTGPTYAVVFVTIDEDARFFDSSTPVPGRTVSNGGTTLTFTGTLLGPDPSDCELLPLVDPFDFVDTCTEQSFTLFFVEGITYWVSINDDEPFAAVFGLGDDSRTYLVEQGDRVSVVPTADPGYALAPEQPTPLDREFAVYGPDECQLPELPNWPASVTVTDQVCTPLGLTGGALTVLLSTGPEENPVPVRYFIAYGTPEQRELTAATTSVAPGSYVVTAVASVTTDSINNAGNTAEFEVTVDAAADQECDLPTLAFTGATSALAGLGAASLLLLLAGFGIMIARRQRA